MASSKLDYTFNCGDLIKIIEPDTGEDIYPCPAIFIDNSVPSYIINPPNRSDDSTFIKINNKKMYRFYKVFLVQDGYYEWFDLPYWNFQKVS